MKWSEFKKEVDAKLKEAELDDANILYMDFNEVDVPEIHVTTHSSGYIDLVVE
jgi:hypothetical protein